MADVVVNVTTWGRRHRASWKSALFALAIVTLSPVWIVTNWIALERYGGSLQAVARSLLKHGISNFYYANAPAFSSQALLAYLAWVSFQAFLYNRLPGPISQGQMTPAGNLLIYSTNGLLAWIVTHILFVIASIARIIDPAIIARNWEPLLVAVNIYGLLLPAFAMVKAYNAPTHKHDRKFSGSLIYDYFMGIELNPRFGEWFDYKLFYNGRPGILAWTLIDLSWIAYQYQTFGYISKSIVIASFFHFVYVLDFFYNEAWYLKTIDIAHDHFGFYLSYGTTAFLPNIYTLQVQYLGRYPVHLSMFESTLILAIGISAYALFRSVNSQKDIVRATNGKSDIWGKPAEYITTSYTTSDGKTHNSLLLTSGWWGMSRHANYTADLMLSWAMCATCGTTHLLPWTYFFFMSVLLYHRIQRDERRCAKKYGKYWLEYTERVKYKLIPGVW
jgi:7-dehydrocholesterol reductase